jgi:PHD/YefM family antitoxin component YafN of YafNO toxin-antitoxin module
MFEVDSPTTFASISELRDNAKQTLAASRERPVVVLVDGRPAGALISMEQLHELQEYHENERIARLAARRLAAIRAGSDTLIEHDEFWSKVDARTSKRATSAV